MADYQPVYAAGAKPFTATTSAAVTGGRVLRVSGDGTVAQTSTNQADVIGVAAHDAASGGRVTVWPLTGCVHELAAPAAITAGAGVVAAADGQVATAVIGTAAAAGTLLGIAATTAASNKVRVVGRN